jgi:hypothetical protein
MFKSDSDYLYGLSEREAANILDVSVETMKRWRRGKIISPYLYRNCGPSHKPHYRYNKILLTRWSILPIEDRPAEEVRAKDLIANYGLMKK